MERTSNIVTAMIGLDLCSVVFTLLAIVMIVVCSLSFNCFTVDQSFANKERLK